MEQVLFGEGWLDRLLGEPSASPSLKRMVRETMRREEHSSNFARSWREVERLLKKGEVGRALREGMSSLRRAMESLRDLHIAQGELAMPFSPFLIGEEGISVTFHPRVDLEESSRLFDDLETIEALGLLNLVRRLLASWGVPSWKGLPEGLIRRLEGDLEELRRIREELRSLDEDDMEAEADLADHYADASSRFARDLFELHLLNARHPEVRLRFRILWDQVEMLLEEESFSAAVQEAFSVLEEAFATAGLGGTDLLEMVDILYPCFSEPEELRRAVDAMTASLRDSGAFPWMGREREFVGTLRKALADMGLLDS